MHGINKNCLQNFVLQHQEKRLNTLCWWCGFSKWKHKYHKKAHRRYYTQISRWMWKSTEKPRYVVNIREFHLILCFMVGGYQCCGGTICLCGQCNIQYVPEKWWFLSIRLKTSHPRSHCLVFTVITTLNCKLFSVKCCSALFDRVSSSDQYNPATCGLPLFLLHLTTGVIWDEEKSCFDSFCREIARFYSQQLESDYWLDGHEDNVSQVHICHAPVVLLHTVIWKKSK